MRVGLLPIPKPGSDICDMQARETSFRQLSLCSACVTRARCMIGGDLVSARAVPTCFCPCLMAEDVASGGRCWVDGRTSGQPRRGQWKPREHRGTQVDGQTSTPPASSRVRGSSRAEPSTTGSATRPPVWQAGRHAASTRPRTQPLLPRPTHAHRTLAAPPPFFLPSANHHPTNTPSSSPITIVTSIQWR